MLVLCYFTSSSLHRYQLPVTVCILIMIAKVIHHVSDPYRSTVLTLKSIILSLVAVFI